MKTGQMLLTADFHASSKESHKAFHKYIKATDKLNMETFTAEVLAHVHAQQQDDSDDEPTSDVLSVEDDEYYRQQMSN